MATLSPISTTTTKGCVFCSKPLDQSVYCESIPLVTRVAKIKLPSGQKTMNHVGNGMTCQRRGLARLSVEVADSKTSFAEGNRFQLDDVIEAQQFDRDILNDIFEVARDMEKVEKYSPWSQILKGYLMATLFYEPSTRTRLSFESAMKRLGGEVLTTENAREFSSAAKGETLEDSIRTVEGYSDIIVMRHFESGAARRAAATAGIPVINAGDGPGQHPTQGLLDVYTIEREVGKLDCIRVALVGDLANGRTVRSLAYLLAKYQDVKIYFVSPDVVKMKDDIKEYLTLMGVEWEESTNLMEVASKCDVVYQTRIQRERFGERIDLYEEARGKYIVDKGVLNVMQKHAVVMHPLPRLDEITVDVDSDPRAAYFRQAKNGLYIRMALLKLLLVGWLIILGTSPRPWLISKLSQCPSLFLLMPTQGYSDQHGSTEIEAERASSTAEEFEKIAEEKLKDAEQGIAGTEKARLGDGDPEYVKKRRETHEEGADHRRLQKDD